jgi:hypothetical protein
MPIKKNPEPAKRTTLRLSPALYDHLQKARKYHGNTLNAEIIARLEATVTTDQFEHLSRELAEIKALLLDGIKK